MHFDDATHEDAAPSRQELLARAAELGPQRLTYASILMPTDPVLSRKMQPSVAERRARLRTGVKIALGVCIAFALFAATRASAMSLEASDHGALRSGPAVVVIPVEKLEQIETVRAGSSHATAHTAPLALRGKRR